MIGDEISRISAIAKTCSFPMGSLLFAIGDEAENLFVLMEGQLEFKLPVSIAGKSVEVCLETIVPGQAVGWSALVPPHKMTLSAFATTDCTLSSFSRTDLISIFKSNAEIGWKVMGNLARVVGRRLTLTQAMLIRQLQTSLNQGLNSPNE